MLRCPSCKKPLDHTAPYLTYCDACDLVVQVSPQSRKPEAGRAKNSPQPTPSAKKRAIRRQKTRRSRSTRPQQSLYRSAKKSNVTSVLRRTSGSSTWQQTRTKAAISQEKLMFSWGIDRFYRILTLFLFLLLIASCLGSAAFYTRSPLEAGVTLPMFVIGFLSPALFLYAGMYGKNGLLLALGLVVFCGGLCIGRLDADILSQVLPLKPSAEQDNHPNLNTILCLYDWAGCFTLFLLLGLLALVERVTIYVDALGTIRFLYVNPLNHLRIPSSLVFSGVRSVSYEPSTCSILVHRKDGVDYLPNVFHQIPQKERMAMVAYINQTLRK